MHKKMRGFTVIEVATVVVILAILVTISLVVFQNIQRQSRDSTRQSDVLKLQAAVERYIAENSEAPWPASGYDKGTGYDIAIITSMLVPRYIEELPTPPQPNTMGYYRYIVDDTTPTKWSIEVRNEASPVCQIGNRPNLTWWNNAPLCRYGN